MRFVSLGVFLKFRVSSGFACVTDDGTAQSGFPEPRNPDLADYAVEKRFPSRPAAHLPGIRPLFRLGATDDLAGLLIDFHPGCGFVVVAEPHGVKDLVLELHSNLRVLSQKQLRLLPTLT